MTANRLVRPSNLRVRAPRIPLDLKVDSRTIGTSAFYKLQTEDISRSGMLLVWERGAKMPFIENTILEMTIDPERNCLKGPVSCLGKVVRREDKDEDGLVRSCLGIQIVQMDHTDLNVWEGCLVELEKKFGIQASKKIPGVDPEIDRAGKPRVS